MIGWLVVFALILVIPNVGLFQEHEEVMESEKRLISPMPSTDSLGSRGYNVALAKYYNDRFLGRDIMIRSAVRIKEIAFNTSHYDKVIFGRDGFLFYNFGDMIADRRGQIKVSETYKRSLSNATASLAGTIEKHGAQFIFMIAPNKATIYPQHLPGRVIGPQFQSRAHQLEEYYIDNHHNYFYYPHGPLVWEVDSLTYYKTDTHWNHGGALIALEYLLTNQLEFPWTRPQLAQREKSQVGDLARMARIERSERIKQPVIDVADYHVSKDGPYAVFENPDAPTNKTVMLIHDSFGNYLRDWLVAGYTKVILCPNYHVDVDAINGFGADLVIYEIVERNIPELDKIFNLKH